MTRQNQTDNMAQTTVFRGRGVAQKAALQAARQADQEWREAGENGPQPAPFVSLGERAARQRGSSLNFTLPVRKENKAQRDRRLEAEALERERGDDPRASRETTAAAALLPVLLRRG